VLDGLLLETDLGGRFAGKILALVVERNSLSDVETWSENALARISERLFEAAGRSLSLTCSIGLAEISSGTDRVEDLIRSAERALERAREGGGNCCVLEETSDESTRIKRFDEIRARQIKSALVEGRFRLVHLNIASLGGKAERIYDTFIRMVDEQGDELAAAEFMESARRSGLMRMVDRWVIEASLDFCAKHASDLVFVKLTHESVLDTTLWSWIEERARRTGVKPERLCFQVLEDDASKYQKQTGALAECLRRRGFRFAIEQFGMGRDPVRLLGCIPMDFVKFDGALSQGLTSDTSVQEKMRGYVASAAQRDIKAIATHVENANTMALLFQLGVAYM
jgi:EAL domain-containing protein (putative c-di-GMP-specific phosphodiesterase class I)